MSSRFIARALVLCVLIGLTAGATFGLQQSKPIAQTTPALIPGLIAQVTIRRDERGIPYIQAKNDHDLYLAQGYVTASDRLWQMDLLRRSERGQLAEILSAGPNNVVLDQDKQHRTLGFSHVAEVEFAAASPQSRAFPLASPGSLMSWSKADGTPW